MFFVTATPFCLPFYGLDVFSWPAVAEFSPAKLYFHISGVFILSSDTWFCALFIFFSVSSGCLPGLCLSLPLASRTPLGVVTSNRLLLPGAPVLPQLWFAATLSNALNAHRKNPGCLFDILLKTYYTISSLTVCFGLAEKTQEERKKEKSEHLSLFFKKKSFFFKKNCSFLNFCSFCLGEFPGSYAVKRL